MNRKISGILLIALISIFNMVSVMAENHQNDNNGGSIISIDKNITSPFISLHLNADVAVPDDHMTFHIYNTSFAKPNSSTWIDLFFGTEDGVKSTLTGYTKEQLSFNLIQDIDNECAFSRDSISTRFAQYRASLLVNFDQYDRSVDWHHCEMNKQANNQKLTPQEAKELADTWVVGLKNVGISGFEYDNCFTMPEIPQPEAGEEQDERLRKNSYYIVNYKRVFNGLPVAVDSMGIGGMDINISDISGDELQVFVDDGGVFWIRGYYREYNEAEIQPLQITLDVALSILEKNMDYVYAFSSNNQFTIDEIELCYRLKQLENLSDFNVNTHTEARPAWRFASDTNRSMTDVYTMFIDAVTGEVLP